MICQADKCTATATTFATGWWRCPAHQPQWDGRCSHSLVGDDRCAYCGHPTAKEATA